MKKQALMDHLFRHQFGKMVSILTRIFGLTHLETIEDAVQDTFVKAMLAWRDKMPDNPEAWLTHAAKNRTIDLFRKLNAEKSRISNFENGPNAIAINELFLEKEIEDSQLRMIFTACHPSLNPRDQIAFSLKTISGFSSKEIASALLLKEETIKKRLSRARKTIQSTAISFEIPQGKTLPLRLNIVLEVLYLIFNEGFHSNKKDILIRQELCGEAMRLSQMLLNNEYTNSSAAYALFALMCFHSARLKSKVNDNNELVDLKKQDRSQWHFPLVMLGDQAMHKAVGEHTVYSIYHYEAAIAAEHLQAKTFESTNWKKILMWYEQLYEIQPAPITLLNMAVIHLQLNDLKNTIKLLDQITPNELEQRAYLFHGTLAEYFQKSGNTQKAITHLNQALDLVKNKSEKQFLLKKKEEWNV